jgi:hypothetical protein
MNEKERTKERLPPFLTAIHRTYIAHKILGENFHITPSVLLRLVRRWLRDAHAFPNALYVLSNVVKANLYTHSRHHWESGDRVRVLPGVK